MGGSPGVAHQTLDGFQVNIDGGLNRGMQQRPEISRHIRGYLGVEIIGPVNWSEGEDQKKRGVEGSPPCL